MNTIGNAFSNSKTVKPRNTWNCWKNIWTTPTATKSSPAKWAGIISSTRTVRIGPLIWIAFSRKTQRSAKEEEEEDEDGEDEFEDDDDLLDDEDEDEDDAEDEDDSEDEDVANHYDRHPLYQAASALTVYVDQLFDENDPAAQRPAAARLTTSITLANVKLAAALTDDDVDELGMTIAYLKRALKAATTALDATAQCETEKLVDHEGAHDLRMRIFQVRDGIILLMGHYRNEWRRRYGQGH